MESSCKHHLVELSELLARLRDLVQVRLVELLHRISVELPVGSLDGLPVRNLEVFPVEALGELRVELLHWVGVELQVEALGELLVELLSAFQVEFPGWNSRQVELPGWSSHGPAHSLRPTSSGQADGRRRWNSRWSTNSALADVELQSPAVGRQCKVLAANCVLHHWSNLELLVGLQVTNSTVELRGPTSGRQCKVLAGPEVTS